MRDIALTLIFISFIVFVFARPYIGIYIWTWLSLMNPHRLTYGFAFGFPFAQITAIVTLIAMLASDEPKRIPWTRETVLLLLFILWMLFTTVFAFYPHLAWEQWGKVWKIMFMIYVTLILINTRQKLDWMVWVIVLSLGLYGVKGGIFTIATAGAFRVQGPLGSFIAGNNEIALALIMIIPLMRYLQLQAESIWIRHGLAVSMLLTGIAAIGDGRKDAMFFVLGGLSGAFLYMFLYSKLDGSLLFEKILGGEVTLALTPNESYQALIKGIPGIVVAVILAAVLGIISWKLPGEKRE